MADVKGHCDPHFSELSQILQDNVKSGVDLGASICINLNGKNVVDIWAGYTDETRTKTWEQDTIVNVWSTTKTITALAAFVLVERGQLDLEENVAKYWPEFAANGKENVKVKHILSHTSGLSGWEQKMKWQDICDFDKAATLLAQQKPWWEPGSKSGYHAMTMGHLVGEVVRRVTGKSLKQFVAEDIAGPLQADFQFGAKEKDWPRIATLVPPPPPPPPATKVSKDSVLYKTFTRPVVTAKIVETPLWRGADLGAANGHANARSIARMLSPITLGGSVEGLEQPLLSPKTIQLIFNEQYYGYDLVIGEEGPIKWGTGFGLAAPGSLHGWLPEGRVCFWQGWGGSLGMMDLDRGITIAYAMNKMDLGTLGGARTQSYVRAAYRALGIELQEVLPPVTLAPKL